MNSPALDRKDANRIGVSPQQLELVVLLNEKYGVPLLETESLDHTGLMRIAGTFEFLSNNLPPNSLQQAKR